MDDHDWLAQQFEENRTHPSLAFDKQGSLRTRAVVRRVAPPLDPGG